jgi:hypothetical protein
MTDKEFEKYREEAIRFYLARCLEHEDSFF